MKKGYISVLLLLIVLVTACNSNNEYNPAVPADFTEVVVDSITVIKLDGEGIHPVFSPADKYLFYTNLRFNGIYRYNLENEVVDTITASSGSGYSYKVKDNDIYYVFNTYNSLDKTRNSQLIKYNLESGDKETIYETNQRIQGVSLQGNDQLSFFVRDSLLIYNTDSENFTDLENFAGLSYLISKGKMRFITSDGISEHTISEKYNIVDVEPINRDSLLVNLAGRGLYLFNPKTESLDSLNTDFFPVYDGSKLYAFTYQATEGHKVDTSRVIIKSLDGTIKTPISIDRVNLDENPHWSNNGRMIAYNNFSGQIMIAYLSYH